MTYKEFQFTISTPDTESKSYSIRLHNGFNKWHCIQYVNESGELFPTPHIAPVTYFVLQVLIETPLLC